MRFLLFVATLLAPLTACAQFVYPLKVQLSGVTVNSQTLIMNFTSGCTPTKNGTITNIACSAGPVSNTLYVGLAANYNNQTGTPTDIVSGSLTTSGGNVLVQASGSVFCSNAQNDAIIDNLTDDSALGILSLYIDGVIQPYATAQIQAAPTLSGGTWFQSAQQTAQIFVRISGLAAGAHTFAIKGKVTVPNGPFSSLLQVQAAAGQSYNFNMLVTEL